MNNLNTILSVSLLSSILVAPLMAMNEAATQPPAQYPQQPVILQSERGPINVADMVKPSGWLDISNQNLVGQLPEDIANLTEMNYLSLNNNKLSGEITAATFNDIAKLNVFEGDRNSFTSFTGTGLWDGQCHVTWSIAHNPFQEFTAAENVSFILSGMSNSAQINIHFDGSVFNCVDDLQRLQGILKSNVVNMRTDFPIRIAFYPETDVSPFLQDYGINHDTVLNKSPSQAITVEGLVEGYEAQPLIEILKNVRDGTRMRFRTTKSSRS